MYDMHAIAILKMLRSEKSNELSFQITDAFKIFRNVKCEIEA